MILGLNSFYKDLDGEEITKIKYKETPDGPLKERKAETVARTLAEALLGTTQGISTIKATDWAQDLAKGGSIDIDRDDLILLKTFLENTNTLNNMGKRPIILAIENLLLEKSKEDKVKVKK